MNKDTLRQALVILVLIVVIGTNILVNTLASVSYNIAPQLLNPGKQRCKLAPSASIITPSRMPG